MSFNSSISNVKSLISCLSFQKIKNSPIWYFLFHWLVLWMDGWLLSCLVRSFACSLVRSFAYSLVRSFVRPLIRSLVRSFVLSCVYSFVRSFVLASIRSFGLFLSSLFVYSFAHLSMYCKFKKMFKLDNRLNKNSTYFRRKSCLKTWCRYICV